MVIAQLVWYDRKRVENISANFHISTEEINNWHDQRTRIGQVHKEKSTISVIATAET